MFRLKPCRLGIALALFGCAATHAAPPMTVVQDILFNADGTHFNGIVAISWPSFQASDTSTISARSVTVRVDDGLLRVPLVPTTNALTSASYTVVYTSNTGTSQTTEYWNLPPSSVPIRLPNIRVASPGTVVGGGSSGGTTTPGSVTNPVAIADVTGLSAALSVRPIQGTAYAPSRTAIINASGALDAAIGNLGDCVHVDGTSGACGGGTTAVSTFVDAETPGGAVNGLNTTFTLNNTPSPAESLKLYRNGLLMSAGPDYTLSAQQLTFTSGATPQPNDVLVAAYRIASAGAVTQSTGLELASAAAQTKPDCAPPTRFLTWSAPGAPGQKDSLEVCAKDAQETYAWRKLY